MTGTVYAIATMDTKGRELRFLADAIRAAGVKCVTVDVGTQGPPTDVPDISRERVLGDASLPSGDRGEAVTAMAESLERFLVNEFAAGRVRGVIGIGGSGGTAVVTPAMRALPIGVPKLMVSTVASGNVAPYVDCCDITMMNSVVDVSGLNGVLQRVLRNAAAAMAGMVRDFEAVERKPAIGMTMFGVTTPCVTAVREALESPERDCLVFHATGAGGRAMEKLVASGFIEGVLDVTTTEVADEIVGGIMPAGAGRMDAILESQMPYVVSVGAVDMVNFGGLDTVPEKFRDRLLHVHNSEITLMRTTPEENRAIARWIAEKLNRATSPVTVLLPEGGVSALDAPGQPFHDEEADAALFDELETQLRIDNLRRLVRLPCHVNDEPFAAALVEEYRRLESQEE